MDTTVTEKLHQLLVLNVRKCGYAPASTRRQIKKAFIRIIQDSIKILIKAIARLSRMIVDHCRRAVMF